MVDWDGGGGDPGRFHATFGGAARDIPVLENEDGHHYGDRENDRQETDENVFHAH
jgi:hypothetical protein